MARAEPVARPRSVLHVADIPGISRLTVDAVCGVTGIVHHMHRNILERVSPFPAGSADPIAGITDLSYRTVFGITRLVGAGLGFALAPLARFDRHRHSTPQREAVLAALNGVLGDHLEQSGNPLAIPFGICHQGRPLHIERGVAIEGVREPREELLILVHGLCMNHLQWNRNGHDHGALLENELDATALYARYNSGRHISDNGQAFADALQKLLLEWPVPVKRIRIVAHSMGGLVSRSACHHAALRQHDWLARLEKIVFLGTPHHGAALERAGNRLDSLIEISPYTAPFSRLGKLRSAGIKDLRYGNLIESDWQGHDSMHRHDSRTPVPLPVAVKCYAIAASKAARVPGVPAGDGLVDVGSALGAHPEPAFRLAFPVSRQWVASGLGHFDLLNDPGVYARIRDWLSSA